MKLISQQKSERQSSLPSCPSRKYLLNRGNADRTHNWKIVCLMFMYVCFVLCGFVSGLILWICGNLWFYDLYAE